MNKSLRRRVAAVATTATVGGLLLPFLAAGSALAATPTSLTVSPTSAFSSTTANLTNFTGTFVGGTPSVGVGTVYAVAVSGPDSARGPQACTFTGNNYSCAFTNGATAGLDQLRFFYDAASGSTYSPSFPAASASLSVAGAVNKIVLAPAAASSAQGVYSSYTATATDAAGRPVPGASINVTATENNTAVADLSVLATPPSSGAMTNPSSPTASSTPATTAAVPVTTSAAAGSAGVATFSVASRSVGSVAINLLSTTNTAVGSAGTLTVNGGSANDVAVVAVSPSSQRAFTASPTSVIVNVQNKQGNPISGVTPVVSVLSGPNSSVTPSASGVSDASGNVTETYTTSATQGQDILQAYVNFTGGTAGLDSGEPSAKAAVNVAANDVTGIIDNGGVSGFTVPLSTKTTTINYTVQNRGGSLAGYNVKFATTSPPVTGAQGTFTLSATSAITDANGNASVTVTDASPIDKDKTSITATLGGVTDSAVVTYAASAVSNATIKITPFANTTTAGGTATFSVAASDQFGAPATGLLYDWSVTGRNSAVSNAGGASSTFSYTDAGNASSTVLDKVVVTARNGSTVVGSVEADQHWVTTPGIATQANIDLGNGGTYTANNAGLPAGQTGPIVASGFTNSSTAGVTADPTVSTNPAVQTVLVGLTDAANNPLYGKSVNFSTTGVGVITDYTGKPLGTSATALVADANANSLYPASTNTYSATVFVRSTQSGKQTITATVDGITTTATVTYTGQFVGVTPVRAMDTRTGQGGLTTGTTGTGSTAPAGPLAPNTPYVLNYASAGIPLDQAAYAFNVTAVHPGGLGNLRVAPFAPGAGVPTTSLINYQSGSDVANFVIVPNTFVPRTRLVPAHYTNALQLYSAASSADVTVDFVGSYATTGSVSATTPSRIADTRSGAGPVAVGETRSFQVAGQGSIPASGAKAVALNVTAVSPGGLGNLRIFADGDAVPTTSNINYIPGQDKSAFVIVNLPANGKIDVFSAGSPVDVAIDAYASFDMVTSNVVTATPARILDTRPGNTLPVTHYLDLQVTGNAGVPANAQAVLVSVTGIHTTGSTGVGNLRVYPSGTALPTISTLNYVSPTSDVANFAIVPIGANGKISIDSEGSPTDVTVDVLGYVPAGS